VPKYGDIRQVRGDELEPVDLIAAGFPCQPISVAGKRLGQADERWLWPECARIIRVVRPRWVLLENVPGLLVRGMGDVLGDLAALGYDAEWQCIPSAAVGAPHLRYRVFIVAYPERLRRHKSKDLPLVFSQGGQAEEAKAAWRGRLRRGASGRLRLVPDAGVLRVADGVPHRVDRHWLDRLRALGNAVVPQVAEWIGRMIMEFAKEERSA